MIRRVLGYVILASIFALLFAATVNKYGWNAAIVDWAFVILLTALVLLGAWLVAGP